MELRNRIHQICLENRVMGTRRVTAALRQQGCPVGRKLVQRLMREDNLLALRKRGSLVTTNSRHTYGVYNNLIRNFRATGANQLWVADITYIRLRQQFVYLAVILDAWSRRVIGWELGENLDAQLTVAALRKAIADRAPQAGVIHHSDRGIQYCAAVYVQILNEAGFVISMSRAGNPQDKAYVSYCTSSEPQTTFSGKRRRLSSLTPCAFRGGLGPGSSYSQSSRSFTG
jgi:transposase InsO family protein